MRRTRFFRRFNSFMKDPPLTPDSFPLPEAAETEDSAHGLARIACQFFVVDAQELVVSKRRTFLVQELDEIQGQVGGQTEGMKMV